VYSSCPVEQFTSTFDVDKVLALEHPADLIRLAYNPDGFSAMSTYDAVLRFIDSYTTKVKIFSAQKPRPCWRWTSLSLAVDPSSTWTC
jgi:hypothetical protein